MPLPAVQPLILADGRRLGYARYGAADGRPVFYLHGLPGSRFECRLIDRAAQTAGVCVIAPERPGYGQSSPRPADGLLNDARDIRALADALHIDCFAVIGVSGGAPSALACAHAMPDRVLKISLVAGLGPLYVAELRADLRRTLRLLVRLASARPRLFSLAFGRPVAMLGRHWPGLLIRLMAMLNGAPDRRTLLQPSTVRHFAPSLRACFAQGDRGGLRDLRQYRRRWDFELGAIAQPVQLWHGLRDPVVPPSHSRYLHARLPASTLELVADAGHFSLPIEHQQEILTALR